jgi:hypothetical protein
MVEGVVNLSKSHSTPHFHTFYRRPHKFQGFDEAKIESASFDVKTTTLFKETALPSK